MSVEKGKVFVGPDDGVNLPTLDMVHKVTAQASGGSLAVEESGLPPGGLIPSHTHTREDECNVVLKGELTRVGGKLELLVGYRMEAMEDDLTERENA